MVVGASKAFRILLGELAGGALGTASPPRPLEAAFSMLETHLQYWDTSLFTLVTLRRVLS
jgi:hypothetical protein